MFSIFLIEKEKIIFSIVKNELLPEQIIHALEDFLNKEKGPLEGFDAICYVSRDADISQLTSERAREIADLDFGIITRRPDTITKNAIVTENPMSAILARLYQNFLLQKQGSNSEYRTFHQTREALVWLNRSSSQLEDQINNLCCTGY